MPLIAKGKIQITAQIAEEVARAIEQYRFNRQFASKNAAVEFLLRHALKANPPNPGDGK